MDLVLQRAFDGITIGAVYALIALGYTMVYGILRLINFAHGAVFMLGAYRGLTILFRLDGAHPVLGLVSTLVLIIAVPALACAGIGFLMDWTVYRPQRALHARPLIPLIGALGISLVLEIAAMLIWSKEFLVSPKIFPDRGLSFGRAGISGLRIMLVVTCVLLMVGLHLFVQHTRLGKAMRAASLDHDAARLVGVDVNNIVALTFILGSSLAAVAGVLVGMYYGSVNFRMGYVPGLKALTAAVLGEVGNIPGAMLGGFIIGLIEAFGAGYISGA